MQYFKYKIHMRIFNTYFKYVYLTYCTALAVADKPIRRIAPNRHPCLRVSRDRAISCSSLAKYTYTATYCNIRLTPYIADIVDVYAELTKIVSYKSTLLHCALASCGAVYCYRSCLCVCVFATGGRAVSEPYYSQRARSVCVSLSAFFVTFAVTIWCLHCFIACRYIDNLYSPPSGRKKEEKNNNKLTKLNYYNIHSTISSRN